MVKFFTKTAIGYSHVKSGKICQDYSASYHDDERTIVTACDGHGGNIYIRSDRGSKFASESIINVFKHVDRGIFYRANREEIEKKLRLEILCEWNALVERDLAQKPIAKRETVDLDEEKIFRLKTDPQVAYGTTLNGAMIFGNKLFCASLGDGGCFAIKHGEVLPVFADETEENVAKETAKAIKTKRARIAALDDLMSKAYEDKLLGKMPEELCLKFIDRYIAEQENLRKEVSGLEAELRNAKDMRENIDEFMSRIKKYLDVTVITREMMLELFDKIIIGEKEPPNGAPRLIQLVYKVDIDSVL